MLIILFNWLFSSSETEIRLAIDDSSSNLPKGRVEIVHNGIWGRICGTNWDMKDANVLCRQLYNSTAESIHAFKNGSGPIHLSNFNCTGTEMNILDCPHNPWGNYKCNDADAAVVCRGRYDSFLSCFCLIHVGMYVYK